MNETEYLYCAKVRDEQDEPLSMQTRATMRVYEERYNAVVSLANILYDHTSGRGYTEIENLLMTACGLRVPK